MPSWWSSPSEKEQRQKQGHMVYTCGRFHSMVEKGVRLPRELYQNRHLCEEASALLMSEKAKIFCLESRLTGDTRITNFLFEYQKIFTHLTCRLVSCCCWWAMVCFTNTLLMLCSMAYFFAWERGNIITFKFLIWSNTCYNIITQAKFW